jgi:hypothetical protein
MAFAEVGSGSQRAVGKGSGDSDTTPFPANVTAGSLLIVTGAVFVSGGAPASIGVTDTRSTPYTVLLGDVPGGESWRTFIAYGIAPTSGACTVTVNPAGSSGFYSYAIDEFSGPDAAPLDVNGGTSTGETNSPSDSITTGVSGALIVGVVAQDNSSASWTPGSGYTELGEDETYDGMPFAAEFKVAGGAGANTVDWATLSSSSWWAAQTASFKPAGGAAAQVPKRPVQQAIIAQ